MRWLAGSALVVLAVIAAGFVAQRLFGSHSDNRMREAREAIEALPYGISTEEASEGVLVGTVQGHLGVVVHFVVNESGASESRHGPRTQSKAQREERSNIGVAIEKALCGKSIGEACPP